MARPSNTDERREQITKALQKVMAKKGYDGASVGDVAAAAGLTAGLVHYHFKNKLEILIAVLDRLVDERDANLARALKAAEGNPLLELAVFIDFHLALGRAAPETLACWITLSGEALRQSKVRKAFEAAMTSAVEHLSGIIERGVAAGVFECGDSNAAACALVAVVQGYFVLAATSPDVIPPGSAASAARSMASGLLRLRAPLPKGDRR